MTSKVAEIERINPSKSAGTAPAETRYQVLRKVRSYAVGWMLSLRQPMESALSYMKAVHKTQSRAACRTGFVSECLFSG